jgi:hypothetical protein
MSFEDALITGLSRHQHTARKSAVEIAHEVLGDGLALNHYKGQYVIWLRGSWSPDSTAIIAKRYAGQNIKSAKPE